MSNQCNSRRPSDTGQDISATATVLARTERLRRHGLEVSDNAPNRVRLLLDIPHNNEVTATTLELAESLANAVSTRLITKEFCNSHAPLRAGYGRVAITLITEKETPFEIYRTLYEGLLKLLDTLWEDCENAKTSDAVDEAVEERTSEEHHVEFQWAESPREPSAKVWLSTALMNQYRQRATNQVSQA